MRNVMINDLSVCFQQLHPASGVLSRSVAFLQQPTPNTHTRARTYTHTHTHTSAQDNISPQRVDRNQCKHGCSLRNHVKFTQ